MSVGLERLAPELAGGDAPAEELARRLAEWEDLLVLLVDPESPQVRQRGRKRRLLSFLLERAGLDEQAFWRLSRGQRGRLFLSRYSRVSRDIPQLEVTSFDLDKLAKERFRQEPLTLGAAWHHGFWRAYFSHAAITHPANDGLREEFSTAWDIVRKEPAVLFRTAEGPRLAGLRSLRIDMPMIVGPLPHGDGHTLERAYLRAVERADPDADLHTRTLVVVEGDALIRHHERLAPHAAWIMPRLSARHLEPLDGAEGAVLRPLLGSTRIVELEWSEALESQLDRLRAVNPDLLFSVYLPYRKGFWPALERTARAGGVAMVHVHAGAEKSYRLIPRVDAYLKERLIRARVQLVSAGGDTDTQASAATVYESVLLGANGGAMTHVASLALVPELVDAYHGADPAPVVAGLASRDPEELERLALNTLTCWQHSILDFLSCMGIDDIQKTSGNTMAITLTEDWVREVDALATPEFAALNRELNAVRVAAEPPPRAVRERYRVSALLRHVVPDLPLAHAARIMAQQTASWHLMNSNRSLTADFLEVCYRMAAGEPPRVEDFLVQGDLGPLSLDGIELKLSRASLEWSLERLRRDPALLDYIFLGVPRGFLRPGAVPPHAEVRLLDRDGSRRWSPSPPTRAAASTCRWAARATATACPSWATAARCGWSPPTPAAAPCGASSCGRAITAARGSRCCAPRATAPWS